MSWYRYKQDNYRFGNGDSFYTFLHSELQIFKLFVHEEADIVTCNYKVPPEFFPYPNTFSNPFSVHEVCH